MNAIIIALVVFVTIDAIGTIILIAKARRNPFLKQRLVLVFKFLVGDAHLVDNHQCPKIEPVVVGEDKEEEIDENEEEEFHESEEESEEEEEEKFCEECGESYLYVCDCGGAQEKRNGGNRQ